MLILLKAEQLGLFEATTIVKPHVRKDGVVVKPHARKVKRRQEPVRAKVVPKRDAAATLDLFAQIHDAPAKVVEHKPVPAEPSAPKGGIRIKPGKGFITGKFLADLDGDSVPGGPWDTEEAARAAAEKWRETLVEWAKQSADMRARKDALVQRLKNGGEVADGDLKLLNLRAGTSDLKWFIPAAADLFGIGSRQVRPYIRDLIRVWHTDMGAKRESVPPKKALRAIAAALAGRTEPSKTASAAAGIDYDGAFDPDSIPAFGVTAGVSKAERRRINAQALEILRSKPAGDLTHEDRAVLSQYSGTGGIGDSLNEFYTDTRVAAGMWKALYDMGLPDGAEVLEPSCATGVFMHTAPAGVRVTGVELDENSAGIARALHGDRHEVHNASLERFARQDGRQFDAVIGNPPFGLRGSLIKDDKPDLSTAEAYFIDTALDKCKPGGLVALIVPSGVMDSRSGRSFRERMLRKGTFLGALRMPNTAFEHAHTGVTTDVIFLRKRPDDVAGALMTVDQDVLRKLGVWDDDFLAGRYFTDGEGQSRILGTMTEGWRAKAGMGQDITVEGSMIGVPEAIAGFRPSGSPQGQPTVPDILDAIGDDEQARQRALGGANKRPYGEAKVGDTKVVDGVTYVLQGDPPRWHKVEDLMQRPEVADALPLAEEIDRLMTGRAADRPALEAAIRAYVEKHGNPGKLKELQAAAGQDKVLYRLIGAVKPDGSLSDAVTGRLAEKLEGTFDVIAHTLATRDGSFSVDRLAEQLGKDPDEVLDTLYASPLYAHDPGAGTWTTMDAYLSGDLWPKLDAVNAALEQDEADPALKEKYRKQAQALEDAIDPAALEDVFVTVNSAWIPLDIVSEFFTRKNEEGNQWQRDLPPVQITFANGVYSVTGGNPHGDTKLLERHLNRTGVRKDDLPTIRRWDREFHEWLCASPYRDRIEDLYNRKFRGFLAREYSKEPFEVPGLNPEGLKDYQWAGLRWALETGKGIIAADVGLGKTARGLILARMAKVSGQAKKPVIVVPKSVLANWVVEANKWFPGASVLTIGGEFEIDENGEVTGKDDTAADRKRKYHDLTQNDYDFVLISQPAFNELDVSPALKGNYLADDFWVQRGEALGHAGDKRIRRVREQFEQSAARREFGQRTDAIYFDELGVDMLMIDEGHAYKNLYAARNRFGESPKFLGGQGLSNRSFDLSFKARYIRDTNGGKNVYMLTATPTKNSPLEIYSMLSYIAPEAFERIGIRNSEEFIDRFCEFERQNILGTNGEIEEALVTVGFKNMNELRGIMRRYIDRTTAEDVGLKLPERNDHTHMVDMDDRQKAVYAQLREMAEESANKKDAVGDAHIFSIMDKMNKASIDLALLGHPDDADHESPKYVEAAKHIAAGAKEGGQVVFSDYVDTHEKLANMLVRAGIPRNQIGVINAKVASSSAKRQKISDQFNAGKLKVVIGNTATMGEGINLQKGTTDIHHLDIPWEPASVQQRNGRGLRQGNINEAVRIHTYLSKGSFDGYRWMTVSAKRDWQDLLWNGGDRIENYAKQGDLTREEMMVMLSADPDAARQKLQADKEAALGRFNAERRREAAEEFTRLRSMQSSLRAMKNKGTASAMRLKQKIERAKDALFQSKHFEHKALLENDTPALIHPDSGAALVPGSLIEPHPDSKLKGRVVVTEVIPNRGIVRVRHHGSVEGAPFSIKVSDIGSADRVGMNDEKAEAAAIAAAMKAKITGDDGIKGVKDLVGLPDAVVRESYSAIQTRLKALAKEYKDSTAYGNVLLVGPDGAMVSAESYGYRDKVQKDHDFALPTAEHREKAINAWLDMERAKTFRMDYQRGSRGRSTQVFKAKYPGGYGVNANPIEGPGKNLFGDEFVSEARRRLQDEVATAARRASTFREAAEALKPLAHVGPYGGGVQWPRRALAVMYAKAKREGVLHEPLSSALPDGSPGWKNFFPAAEFGSGDTVADNLARAAKASGDTDLAAAIYIDSHEPVEALKRVAGLAKVGGGGYSGGFAYRSTSDVTYPRRVLEAMKHLADKHPDIAKMEVKDLARDLRAGSGYSNRVFWNMHMTIGEALDRALEGDHGKD